MRELTEAEKDEVIDKLIEACGPAGSDVYDSIVEEICSRPSSE